MFLDYSTLPFRADGMPETPELVLQTMDSQTIGTIPGAYNIKLNIKFSEPSEISFDVPAVIDGKPNPVYAHITGYMLIYTKQYGIYIALNPSTEADGIAEIKHVTGYSIEKALETKTFFLEEGTFQFYNTSNPTDSSTVIGRILEIAAGWKVGYISPAIAQRYRTFEQYDDYLLSFLYNTVPEKYRCVFVFEPYQKTINVYDADEQRPCLPIYLDFDNLLESAGIEELSDELATAIRPYGADGLDIREVNPTGTNWIYDLGYFIAKGDIPAPLAGKWDAWQRSIQTNLPYYEGLSALQASATAQLLSAQAKKTDLDGELETLLASQSITIQAMAQETTTEGKAYQQAALDEINRKIRQKKVEITQQERLIASIEDTLNSDNATSYPAKINAVVNELGISKYFSEDEYAILQHYFIEQDITEDTFVASDVDVSVSGQRFSVSGETIRIHDAQISEIDLTDDLQKNMYVFSGGAFQVSGSHTISGDVIRGTLERSNSGGFVLSLYAGSITANEKTAPSGMITVNGSLASFSDDITPITKDEMTTYEGTYLEFTAADGDLFLTANVSDYHRYAVKKELYDYAVGVLSDLATPTYEFTVESGNFLFVKEFQPFRDKLELGKGVYLNLGGGQAITPYIIEMEFSFEDKSAFSIVFSNRFKRHDNVNTLKDMIEKSYSSSRRFDASKYIYNQAKGHASAVSEFMNSSLDAAKNTILAAANQSVVINGAGIHVGGNSACQLRIVDSMIAMTDDNWEHAKLAIGRFASKETGTYFGVNAEVIGGKLIVGNSLIIENTNDAGVMQFKVDSSGAWLNNSTFVLQKDDGGKILIDPKYGIAAGDGNLFALDGTTVTPSFVDTDGSILFDRDGFPEDTNFYLDIRDGGAYFRGKLLAQSGEIGGFAIAADYLHTGSGGNFVALNGSGTNSHSAYAFWAGGTSPASAKFWVKKDGSISAKDGTFSGTLSAAKLSGSLTAADSESWIVGCGIDINNGMFLVDPDGNVIMNGNLTLKDGVITWGNLSGSVKNEIYDAQDAAYDALDAAGEAEDLARKIANGQYSNGTFISGTEIYSPTIYSNEFNILPQAKSDLSGSFNLYSYYDNKLYHFLKIYYDESDAPLLHFSSPNGAYLHWDISNTYFHRNLSFNGATLDFQNATIRNLNITAKFG